MRRSLLLLVALVLGAGCVLPDWMGPPPAEGTASAFADGFDSDVLASGEWTFGHWRPYALERGSAGVEDGWLYVALDPSADAWSAGHAFRADAREVYAEARVRASGPVVGVALASNRSWASLVVNDDSFCFCARVLGHDRGTRLGPPPVAGATYTLRFRLDWRGEGEAWVLDAQGREIGHALDASFELRPAQVSSVWVGTAHLVNAPTRPTAQFDYALAWSGNLPPAQLARLRDAVHG